MVLKEITKQELFENIKNIMDQYCEGCFLHKHLKKECGKRAAHRFCITTCTVGEKIKKFGEKLS